MKKDLVHLSTLKFLNDNYLSLEAKGFLLIALVHDEITPLKVKDYCSDDEETLKDVLLELRINKYIKLDNESNTLLVGPEPYPNWDKEIIDDLHRRIQSKEK